MRVGEIQCLQLGLFFQCLGDSLVERTLHVGRLNLVLDDRRVGGCRSQALPGLGVERAARLEPVGLLKRGDRLFVIGPVLAVDLTRREAGAIEQHLGLDGRGHAGSGSASLARRRRHLGCIDGLRIEHGRGGGADLALPLDLASAAPDVTSIAPAQTRTRARPLPTERPRRRRLVWTVRSSFLASGAAQPGTSSSIAIVNSWSRRSGSALSTRTQTASAYQPRATPRPAPFHTLLPASTARPHGRLRPTGLDVVEQTLNFLDRREAKPDLNTAHSLVQWNFFARGDMQPKIALYS